MRPLPRLALACGALLSSCGPSAGSAPVDAAPLLLDQGLDAGADSGRDAGRPFDGAFAVDGGAATVVRIHYPLGGSGAKRIAVRGSLPPLDWSHGADLAPGPDDTWTWQSDALAGAAPLEFKPLLDDATWSRGPNFAVLPGSTVDVYPHFLATKGKVVTLLPSFHSARLPRDRPIFAYLPAGYDENPRAHWPVLYMHDGQNLFDAALAFGGNEWKVDETIDAGADTNDVATSIRAPIVIGIGNTADRIWELTPTDGGMGGGGAPQYLAAVVEELKPKVDGMLRTSAGRTDTAMLGSSLGGLASAWSGLQRPEVFALIGAMSPSTFWDGRALIADVTASKGAKPRPDRVYVDSGDSGPSNDDVTDTNDLATAYLSIGYSDGRDFQHVVQPGGQHNEIYWAERLPGALHFLLGPASR